LVAGVTMSEGLVLVERAVSGQVGAGGFELDAEAFHQKLDGDFFSSAARSRRPVCAPFKTS
jgi:hypothetical protein